MRILKIIFWMVAFVVLATLMAWSYAVIFALMPIWMWFGKKVAGGITSYMDWAKELASGAGDKIDDLIYELDN